MGKSHLEIADSFIKLVRLPVKGFDQLLVLLQRLILRKKIVALTKGITLKEKNSPPL